jgi:anti-sigma regulatory factor (Ser/Thr protein kinase)
MSANAQRRNGGSPPRAPGDALELPFDGDSLVALRSTVAAHGSRFGLANLQVDDLVLAAHELATNAVRHGGGRGRLRLWPADGSVFCEIADNGVGFTFTRPDEAPRPPLGASGGRGLWIVARLVDVLQVSTGPAGTVATVRVGIAGDA